MDDATLKRLQKICGLLGSDQPGERAAAALKATELLKSAGKTWADVGIGSGGGRHPSDVARINVLEFENTGLRRMLAVTQENVRGLTQAKERLRQENAAMLKELQALKNPPKPTPKPRPKPKPPALMPERAMRYASPEDGELRARAKRLIEQGAFTEESVQHFVESVLGYSTWSDRQREALDRTLDRAEGVS